MMDNRKITTEEVLAIANFRAAFATATTTYRLELLFTEHSPELI